MTRLEGARALVTGGAGTIGSTIVDQLLEAGVHFGHQKHRWNPKMERFIFGVRNDIHILDLSQTVPMLSRALQLVSDTVADGGRVLTVTALGASMMEAQARAYTAIARIDWPEGFCRRDIGRRAVAREVAGGGI